MRCQMVIFLPGARGSRYVRAWPLRQKSIGDVDDGVACSRARCLPRPLSPAPSAEPRRRKLKREPVTPGTSLDSATSSSSCSSSCGCSCSCGSDAGRSCASCRPARRRPRRRFPSCVKPGLPFLSPSPSYHVCDDDIDGPSRSPSPRSPASPSSASAENQASSISRATVSDVPRRLRQSTFAWFQARAPRAVSASPQSAARTPGTLFAAIDTPVPVQQKSTPWSASRSATRRATASATSGQGAAIAVKRAEELDIVAATSQVLLDELRQMRPFVAAESNTQK